MFSVCWASDISQSAVKQASLSSRNDKLKQRIQRARRREMIFTSIWTMRITLGRLIRGKNSDL